MRWIVVRHLPQDGTLQTDCAIVTADEAARAAEEGARALIAEAPLEVGDSLDEVVAVIAVDERRAPEWFRFDLNAERCELQCCGGAPTDDGHSGYCELHEDGKTPSSTDMDVEERETMA
jgi:hypothetical protein